MERKIRKIGLILFLFILSINSFSFQKLTTTKMRKNTIRINALEIEELDVGVPRSMTIVLDDRALNFDFDKYVVKKKNYEILRNLMEYIKVKNYRVNIVGYTDSFGPDAYNYKLSFKRAEAVKDKLIEFGLEKDRIISVSGKGERNPIASNKTKEDRARNRRVEFKLEKIKVGD